MLRLEALSKRFGDVIAVSDLTLQVREGEFLSLLGPSGCGKTTTLRMIAGFETPTRGRVLMRERDITALAPQQRGMGMVFQSYALFPHLNVFENVAFGLKAKRVRRADIAGRVERALGLVDLAGYERRPVQALSGGQQQRVALARAIAPEPPILLLDEPLSNLDAALRERTRGELRALLKRLGMTTVFVTHDQAEAFDLSDRIAILDQGVLQQLGSPEELYLSPANPFVASFVGKANFLPARLRAVDGGHALCQVADGVQWPARAGGHVNSGPLHLMVRPESLWLLAAEEAGSGDLSGRIAERRFGGPATLYLVDTPAGRLLIAEPGAPRALPERVAVRVREGVLPIAFPAPE